MAADFGDGVEGALPFRARFPQAGLGILRPQQGANRRDELGGLDGLHQVAVGAALEALDLLLGRDERRRRLQDRDGRRHRVGLQPAAHLEPVDVGQLHVQHDQAGQLSRQKERLAAPEVASQTS